MIHPDAISGMETDSREPISFDEGMSAYITTEQILRVEVGTRITNESKTWEHIVRSKDKRIKLTGNGGVVELEVIRNKLLEIAPKIPASVPNNALGDESFPTYLDGVGLRGSVPAGTACTREEAEANPEDSSIAPSSFNITVGEESSFIINHDPCVILTDDYGCRAYPTTGLAAAVHIKSRTDAIRNISEPEWVALETLREAITEKDFRKYLRDGFLLVKGRSGLVYQIFRNHTHVKVWEHGKTVEEICVYFKNRDIPRTDKVLAFKVMVETDENAFKKLGNVYNMRRAA